MRRMPRHLKLKMIVVALILQFALFWALGRQPAPQKLSRRDAEILVEAVVFQANHFDDLSSSKPAPQNNQITNVLLSTRS